jgi:asparagine synthase (glutamine-hydrolysing)
MSGIMGIYNLDDSPVERENLVKMVDILEHRGPDGANIWVWTSDALDYTRISG